MPVDWKKVQIPLAGGLDTKTDRKAVDPPRLLELINGEYTTLGSVRKRNGYRPFDYDDDQDGNDILETGSVFTRENLAHVDGGFDGVAVDRNEIFMSAKVGYGATGRIRMQDGWKLYHTDPIAGDQKDIGPFEPLELNVQTVATPDVEAQGIDMDYALGYLCLAWIDNKTYEGTSLQMLVSIVEMSTGAVVVDRARVRFPSALGTPSAPQVVAVNNSFHIYAIDVTTVGAPPYDLGRVIIPATTLVVPAQFTILASDVHGHFLMDATYIEHTVSGPSSVVAYKENPTATIRMRQYAENGAVIGTALDPGTTTNCLSCQTVYDETNALDRLIITYQSNVNSWIYYSIYDTNLNLIALTRNLTAATAAETVTQITVAADESWNATAPVSSTMRWFLEVRNDVLGGIWPGGTPWFRYIRTLTDTFAGGAATARNFIRNAQLWSKAYSYENRAHVWCVYPSDEQNCYFKFSTAEQDFGVTIDVERCDARLLYQRASGGRANHGLSRCIQIAQDTWAFALFQAEREMTDQYNSGLVNSPAYATQMEPDAGTVKFGRDRIQLGPTKSVAMGGQLVDVDGSAAELGFHLYPEPAGAYDLGGGVIPAGDHQMAAIYEWTDREGQVHRSAPYYYSDNLATANRVIYHVIPVLHKGAKQKLINVIGAVLYHSVTVNCVAYRMASDGVFHRVAAVQQDTSQPYIIISDNLPDATLLGNEILYAEGGVVANIAPPATDIVAATGERAFCVPSDDRGQIWFSKRKADGQGISFSDLQTLRVRKGGPITALSDMDGKVIVFQRNRISFFYGDGPNDMGNGRFSDISDITSDVGCADRRSVVMTPNGLMFFSRKGLYLLDRGLQVSYLGAPAEYANQYDFYSGTLIENKNQVRWILSSGEVLAYDYAVNAWSVQQLVNYTDDEFVDADIWQGEYTILQQDARLLQEHPTTYEDNLTGFGMRITTPWIKVDKLAGWQRVRRALFLGEWYGEHTLTVTVYYDYDDTTVHQTETFTVSAAVLAEVDPQQFRFRLNKQKCQAVKFTIVDSAWNIITGPDAEAYSLASLELEVGMKQGIAKIQAARTIG